jgi:hypothetical protein
VDETSGAVMSRSNVQIATELRKDEALLTRKKILKCGGSVRKQEAVAQQLANSDDVYLQKLEKLKKFSKEKKEVKKKLTQQTEWVQGGFYLINYALRIEAELPTLYQRLMVSMLQERNTSFAEVSELMETNQESRKQNQSFAMLQLHEIKGMLSNVKKHYNRSAQDTSEEAENKRQSIASVLANLIVQMRSSHNDVWCSLNAEEEVLNQQLKEAMVGFSRMQSEYRQLSDDSRLDDELQTMETDNEQIITLLEDWKQKIYELEDEYSQNLEKLSEEKALLHQELCKDVVVSSDTFAGWDEKSHKIFVKIIKRAQVQGLSRQRLSSTLGAELPEKSPKEISAHENWYTSMLSITDRKKKFLLNYTNKREEYLLQASQGVSALRVKVAAEEVAWQDQQRHEKARELMHQQLNQQRAERVNEMQSRLAEIDRLKIQVMFAACHFIRNNMMLTIN